MTSTSTQRQIQMLKIIADHNVTLEMQGQLIQEQGELLKKQQKLIDKLMHQIEGMLKPPLFTLFSSLFRRRP